MKPGAAGEGEACPGAKLHPSRVHRPDPTGGPMNTRTIAVIALIIAVIVLILLLA